jgi:hypothetical protein
MNHFDLESHLNDIYATFPEARRKPMIGITANYVDGDATLRDRYYTQVVEAGGVPVIIPPVADKAVLVNPSTSSTACCSPVVATSTRCGRRGALAPAAWHQCHARPARAAHHPSGLQPTDSHTGYCRGIQTLAVALAQGGAGYWLFSKPSGGSLSPGPSR